MEFKTRGSSSYVATIDMSNAEDLNFLERIRKDIKAINVNASVKLRVVIRGRKPKVKVNNRGYNSGGGVIGGLKNAKEADIYIYNRSN